MSEEEDQLSMSLNGSVGAEKQDSFAQEQTQLEEARFQHPEPYSLL